MSTLLTPVMFVSHGAPTFALFPGVLGEQLRRLGRVIPKPRAVLVVSPHWMTSAVKVTRASAPATIHDFGGFPEALYEIQYRAPGEPSLADTAIKLLAEHGWSVHADERRGLDHGAWIPLLHLYPDADVPVIQVSMPTDLDETSAYALGQALAPLRAQGVLIVGSGSMTHNLHEFRTGVFANEATYVTEFATWTRMTVVSGDHDRLLRIMEYAPHAHRAHPTSEHLLPLIVAASAGGAGAHVTPVDGGITHGVLSMDSFVFGLDAAAAEAFTSGVQ